MHATMLYNVCDEKEKEIKRCNLNNEKELKKLEKSFSFPTHFFSAMQKKLWNEE